MQEQPVQQSAPKSKKQLIWGLICLLGPTALIVVSLLLYAVLNFITGATAAPADVDAATNGNLFGEQSTFKTISNVALFLVGAVSTITLLPGLIVGIVLLATRK